MIEFGKQLPFIVNNWEKDLALPGFPQEKILCAIVAYWNKQTSGLAIHLWKNYGSYGLTTLKNRHVVVKGQRFNSLQRKERVKP